jgi:hypothetical protein
VSERSVLRRGQDLIRTALAQSFDQSQPFGRLALVHGLQAAGSTLITISLAGSLFFSISPDAAKSRVLLYLLLTIAPFAIVGPALSPLLDRSRKARRTSVAVANIGSALACLAMARSIHDLLLFPEAFAVLIFGKLYLVARAALVPAVTAPGDDLATTNARLAVIAALAGFAAFPIGVGLLKISPVIVLIAAACVFGLGVVGALRLPRPDDQSAGQPGTTHHEPATRQEVERERRRLGLAMHPDQIASAIAAMSIARATVGFVEFFLAFGLRREHASTWWFGALLIASGIGSLLGSSIVPRLRRVLTERQILIVSLALMGVGGFAAMVIGGLIAQLLLTFVVGVGPTSAKPALDSLVQKHYPPALLGRAFGRLETRLQLLWVIAALIGVLIPFPLRAGDLCVGVVNLLAGAVYLLRRPRRQARSVAARVSGAPQGERRAPPRP